MSTSSRAVIARTNSNQLKIVATINLLLTITYIEGILGWNNKHNTLFSRKSELLLHFPIGHTLILKKAGVII